MCAIVMKTIHFYIFCFLRFVQGLPPEMSAVVVLVFAETNVMYCSN